MDRQEVRDQTELGREVDRRRADRQFLTSAANACPENYIHMVQVTEQLRQETMVPGVNIEEVPDLEPIPAAPRGQPMRLGPAPAQIQEQAQNEFFDLE